MDTSKAPGIKIGRIILERLTFGKLDMALDLGKPYNISINTENFVNLMPGEKTGGAVQAIRITEQSGGLFSLEIAYSLAASVIEGEENMPLGEFLDHNAPAILYQFSRETILSFTQKAGLPIVLPPVNLANPRPEQEAAPSL